MPVGLREKLLPTVRQLYAKGKSYSRIADELGISRNTPLAWRRHDEGHGGRDWDELRTEQLSKSPYGPLEILRNRLQRLIEAEPEHGNAPGFDDQVLKCQKNIDWFEERLGDTRRILDTLEIFAHWCSRNLGDAELPIAARAIAACIDDLRSGKFGAGASAT